MTTTEFVEEAFVNEFGQKIEPGEEVLFVGSSWKSTSIRRGYFKGVRYANVTRHKYLKDENGNLIKEEKTNWNGSKYLVNKTITKTAREVVSVVVNCNRGKKWKWIEQDGKKEYVKSNEDVFGVSTLPLKRVYKFHTPLSEMEGKYF